MKSCQYKTIKEITQTRSDGSSMRLVYFLTCTEPEESDSPLYGICVNKFEEGCEQPEAVCTPPISHSESFVRQLLLQIIAHAVTPMCLLEVLDELISRF